MSADTPDVGLTEQDVEDGARALFEHFHGPQSSEKYAGTYSWPPPEQHLPWWRDAARAVLAARVAEERERANAAEYDAQRYRAMARALRDAEAKIAAVRNEVLRLADSIHGDSGWEHNGGCEGEPDCFACVEADLRRIAALGGEATS